MFLPLDVGRSVSSVLHLHPGERGHRFALSIENGKGLDLSPGWRKSRLFLPLRQGRGTALTSVLEAEFGNEEEPSINGPQELES